MMTALLEIRNLDAFYGRTQVLHGVELALETGGITAILGVNGAGKTTMLRAICGMVRATGEVNFAGKPIRGLRTETIVRAGIAHVPEGRGTFTRITTEENLRLGAYSRQDVAKIREDMAQVYDYFPRLAARRHQQAGILSGGEQQMLAIARALMLRPRLMLLDEPSFGLAPMIVGELFQILRTINRQGRVSMLLVEQNAARALALADHAYLLETGRIVMSGTAQDIAADEVVRQSYLGYPPGAPSFGDRLESISSTGKKQGL
uniref:Amino acid/amide ABC transporter ATP-binding protein 2, HAAT family n=1 Tax=Candidatus Kentrum sp. TUN TaxID=2126343 RepID=A0A450ZY86_9GAMM|nr:MAG: amino acid/amide ABC transporter ATP-binding protein 2, HAAT family [Candidatus Kentron sp. TUN]